jgi:hypothetical protein
MALNYYIGFSCPPSGGDSVVAYFAIEGTIQIGAIYELLRGTTNIGCWSLDSFEQTPTTLEVSVFNGPWQNCVDCRGDLTPTPTQSSTSTPTVTPTNTATPTNTPSSTVTPTITSSPTQTPTNTVTPTNTSSPTNTPTPTITSTTTNTPTPSSTASPTPTQTASSTNTPTPTNTSTQTQTPTQTATQTATPTSTNTQTPTQTATQTSTPTQTATQTATPTPTPTPFGVFEVDVQYAAEACVTCGDETTTAPYPHPADWVPVGPDGEKQGTVIDLSAVQLGGMHGLNN